MFLDTYFGNGESIEEYEYDPTLPEQEREDPLRPNRSQTKTLLDPRLYYLDVLVVRLKRIKKEWINVVCKLGPRIKESVSSQLLLQPRPCYDSDI
jgi:hypothetical protein